LIFSKQGYNLAQAFGQHFYIK